MWSPIGSFELERSAPGSARVSARSASFVPGASRVERRSSSSSPSGGFSYTLLSGLAIRGYRADVDLERAEHGTVIRWHSSFSPKMPGTGWIYRWQLTRFIGRVLQGLAAHAEAASPNSRSSNAGNNSTSPSHRVVYLTGATSAVLDPAQRATA